MDRRIRRTHKLLVDALVTLALRDGYDAVTIRDITDFADISYSTFFRHFPDKDSLFMSMIAELIEELRTLLGTSEPPAVGGTILFQHVADNQSLYRALLGGLNASVMVQKVQEMIADSILKNRYVQPAPLIPPEIAANHVAASALALVKWWLDHDMPYPPERMGAIYAALIIQPAWDFQPAVEK
ncbi:MAG: TetR/AcrR family transcriptional regulator [Chloroflexota bacterium]